MNIKINRKMIGAGRSVSQYHTENYRKKTHSNKFSDIEPYCEDAN